MTNKHRLKEMMSPLKRSERVQYTIDSNSYSLNLRKYNYILFGIIKKQQQKTRDNCGQQGRWGTGGGEGGDKYTRKRKKV
jgi:hypothetical protein